MYNYKNIYYKKIPTFINIICFIEKNKQNRIYNIKHKPKTIQMQKN